MDLVQEQQALAGRDGLAGHQGEGGQNVRRAVGGEGLADLGIALQVDVHEPQARHPRELAYQGRFAHLPAAANDERLAAFPAGPILQMGEFVTFKEAHRGVATTGVGAPMVHILG